LVFAGATWKYWDELDLTTSWLILSALLLQKRGASISARTLRRRGKINDLSAAGYIADQTAGSLLDEILEVADNAMNEDFGNSAVLFGCLLVCVVRWKLG
jgi:hypothetical protein